MKPTDFSYRLTNFLSNYLPGIVGLSRNTILSYRDTFKIFLKYCLDIKKIKPEIFFLSNFTKDTILEFLEWLEKKCKNSGSTRNVRLSAFHSFSRYLQFESPEHIQYAQEIITIPIKKIKNITVKYITLSTMKSLLSMPEKDTIGGRRDSVLLSLLYDSGARVQEIVDLKVSDVRIEKPSTIKLTGKGNKSRIVPIMERMAKLIEQYMDENNLKCHSVSTQPFFTNRSKNKLTRAGIAHILKKHVNKLQKMNPGIIPEKFSPHCFRHSKAIHLLQSDVNIIYIRDLLGHSDIRTTEVYARTDSEMKRKALEKGNKSIVAEKLPEWQSNNGLMDWCPHWFKKTPYS